MSAIVPVLILSLTSKLKSDGIPRRNQDLHHSMVKLRTLIVT